MGIRIESSQRKNRLIYTSYEYNEKTAKDYVAYKSIYKKDKNGRYNFKRHIIYSRHFYNQVAYRQGLDKINELFLSFFGILAQYCFYNAILVAFICMYFFIEYEVARL